MSTSFSLTDFYTRNTSFEQFIVTPIQLHEFISNIKKILNNPPTDRFKLTGQLKNNPPPYLTVIADTHEIEDANGSKITCYSVKKSITCQNLLDCRLLVPGQVLEFDPHTCEIIELSRADDVKVLNDKSNFLCFFSKLETVKLADKHGSNSFVDNYRLNSKGTDLWIKLGFPNPTLSTSWVELTKLTKPRPSPGPYPDPFPSPDPSPTKTLGIYNPSNTCYMNSFFQAINATNSLRTLLMDNTSSSACTSNDIIRGFRDTLHKLRTTPRSKDDQYITITDSFCSPFWDKIKEESIEKLLELKKKEEIRADASLSEGEKERLIKDVKATDFSSKEKERILSTVTLDQQQKLNTAEVQIFKDSTGEKVEIDGKQSQQDSIARLVDIINMINQCNGLTPKSGIDLHLISIHKVGEEKSLQKLLVDQNPGKDAHDRLDEDKGYARELLKAVKIGEPISKFQSYSMTKVPNFISPRVLDPLVKKSAKEIIEALEKWENEKVSELEGDDRAQDTSYLHGKKPTPYIVINLGQEDGMGFQTTNNRQIEIEGQTFVLKAAIVKHGSAKGGHYYAITDEGYFSDRTTKQGPQYMQQMIKDGYNTDYSGDECYPVAYFYENVDQTGGYVKNKSYLSGGEPIKNKYFHKYLKYKNKYLQLTR